MAGGASGPATRAPQAQCEGMTDPSEAIALDKRPERHHYELTVDGQLAAWIEFRQAPQRLELLHTEVRPGYEGRGLSSRLARFALDDARKSGLKVQAGCPFLAGFIQRNAEYQDLLAHPAG
jgi:predicted GNAT family acetyltransferase